MLDISTVFIIFKFVFIVFPQAYMKAPELKVEENLLEEELRAARISTSSDLFSREVRCYSSVLLKALPEHNRPLACSNNKQQTPPI